MLARDIVCQSCKREPAVEADHIKPKSEGGTDDVDNVQGLCRACHAQKTRRESHGLPPRSAA